MKTGLVKAGILILALAMMLCGCAKPEAAQAPAQETAAAEAVLQVPSVTFIADGRVITLEDTQGKTLQQLLEQARITLGEGDMLALAPEQLMDDNLTVQVLHVSAEPRPTEPEAEPTEPETTEPETKPASTERTVVSVEVYNDCDDSGHGVKVITYSDGTQEEVYF